jgi:hypothetical protein
VSSSTINPGTAKLLINNVSKFSSHLTENTLRLRYSDQPANTVWREKIDTYCENHTKHINALCGQNAGFSVLKRVVRI